MSNEQIPSDPTEGAEGKTSGQEIPGNEDVIVEDEDIANSNTPVEGLPVPIENEDTPTSDRKTESANKSLISKHERKTSANESLKPNELIEKQKSSKKEPLFDSKGSLLVTESYAKERLEELKQKRATFAVLIGDLKAKVEAFKKKSNPTDDDVANLEKHHASFLKKMSEYKAITQEVEMLMGIAEAPYSQTKITAPQSETPKKPPLQEPPKGMESIEEKLPKLIVCGADMGDSIPKIIVCEPLKRAHTEPFYEHSDRNGKSDKGSSSECEDFVKEKLKEAHEAQQKLAKENYDINEMRLNIQQELFVKQELLDNMKQQILAYESDNYRIQHHNEELQRRLMCSGQEFCGGKICKRELQMKYREEPPEGAQFCCKENLENMDQGLESLEEGAKNTFCQQECFLNSEEMSLNYPIPQRKPICKRMLPQKSTQTDADKENRICFESDKDPKYGELREQYQRLHSDFKNKVSEVASLRVDLDKTRTELNDITILHHELEAKYQTELENNSALLGENNNMQSAKDRILDLEQAATFARQMYSSSHEELEGTKALIEDLKTQLDEYRNKYMNTLQIAEELKKGNEFMEMEYENKIAIEIQKMKLEMQDNIKELVPIKELLKVTQQKLKETEQMHTIALETVAQLSQKLESALKELEGAHLQIEQSGTNSEVIENLQYSLEVAEKRLTELENENNRQKETIIRLEQLQSDQNLQLEKKSHEVQLLSTQLETLREESARQVSRLKERSEMIRKCLQAQIAEMEEEVARCRAETSCAHKERDKIRSKLQLEVCLLSENFRESQNRILQLQQHIHYISASHPTAFIDLCK